jgi:enoyl-[acyl-carrier protein] reductase I
MRLTERISARLPKTAPVIELDVTSSDDLAALPLRVGEHVSALDGVVHAIGFAPEAALGGNFLNTGWDDVATALHVSAYSLKALTTAALPLMPDGGSVVGLDFDASVAWPLYDWMGVAKAALESVSRYLARDLGPSGVRVNLVAAGPIRTAAASGIDGFAELASAWPEQAPLGWRVDDPGPVADAACFLLSDLSRGTSGEILHVDGGAHAVAPAPTQIRG